MQQAQTVETCRCEHSIELHQHYRSGSDCAACDCASFRGPGRTTVRIPRQIGSRITGVTIPRPR
jgi:hypothetical protein